MESHRGSSALVSSVVALAALVVGLAAPGSAASAASAQRPYAAAPVARPAAAAPLTVTPSADLVDGQELSLVATGTTPGSTFVFVECGPSALLITFGQLPPDDNPNDGCEEQRNTVLFSDAAGVAAGTLRASAVLSAATGTSDCRVVQCFIALFALAGGPSLQLHDLSFSPDACAAPGSCAVPADWAPNDPTRRAAASTAARRVSAGIPSDRPVIASTTHTVTRHVDAGLAGDLTQPGAVTGPYTGSLGSPSPPDAPVAGEGLVRLALDAPGTSWASSHPTAVVVDVSVDAGPSQQIVLFRGSSPFVYAGFTGPLTTGSHQVSVAVDGALSVGRRQAHVEEMGLEVVAPDNPSYLAYAYAPVMYGRTTSALHDTPLIDDAGATDLGGGGSRVSYTVIWSHEDAGTGFVPSLLGGSWGRFTDIENAMSLNVEPDGTVSGASYLWGGQPPGYPDTQGAVSETDVPFAGSYWGHHPVLRDATGNNDFSDQGTTAFRFQQAPLPGPPSGQPREAVMDANPWTYQVMGEEMDRWYTDVSLDPRSPQPGDARQYAYVQLDATGTGVSSVSVDLQLDGSPTWYDGDFGSGYPLHGAGQVRTVVKLPTDWTSRTITGARLRVFPAGAAASVQVQDLTVRGLDAGWDLSVHAAPAPAVVSGATEVPVALAVSARSGDAQTRHAGSAVDPLVAQVVDSLGDRIDGATVHYAVTSGPALMFLACGCGAVDAVSDAKGHASSGPATAPADLGTVTVDASVDDALAAPAVFSVVVRRAHVQ